MKHTSTKISIAMVCCVLAGAAGMARAQSSFIAPPEWKSGTAGSTLEWRRAASKIKLSAPVQTQGIAASFQAQIAKDASYRGALRSREDVNRDSDSSLATVYTFANAIVAYGDFPRGDGARFMALSSPGATDLRRDFPSFKNIVAQLDRIGSQTRRPSCSKAANGAAPTKKASQAVPVRKSLAPSQIVGVYLGSRHTFGVGGIMVTKQFPVLILRDGTAYKNFAVPPAQLNVASLKKAAPSNAGRWTRTAKGFSVRFNGSKSASEIKADLKVEPASAGQRLSGKFLTISGGGVPSGVTVAASNVYNFSRDGRFSGARSGSAFGEGVAVSSNSTDAGTYSISGYELVLKYGNGTTERRLFYFYPGQKSGKNSVIGIGSSTYIKQ